MVWAFPFFTLCPIQHLDSESLVGVGVVWVVFCKVFRRWVKLFLKNYCPQFVNSVFCRMFTPSNNNQQKQLIMKTLNAKNQKTLEALKVKADWFSNGRMPSVKNIAALLDELGVSFQLIETNTTKPRGGETSNFTTSGGRKVTKGFVLKVPSANIRMDTTCSHFSKNTDEFAREFVELIEKL